MKGADWSPFHVEGRSHFLSMTAADDQQAQALPKDWAALYKVAGLKSFLAVPIGTAHETLGMLTIAKEGVDAFEDEW
jgi:hypothetical protein